MPRRVEVWDAPTRLFHWSLVALVIAAWVTAENKDFFGAAHMLIGETVAGLLVFRLVWGFIGGEHARFSDFAAGPDAIVAHVSELMSGKPRRTLGHNPVGGLAVFLLLLTTTFIVATGLFSADDEMRGPLSGLGPEFSDVHEAAFAVLQVLVVIHLVGVIVESLKTRDPLVPAMIRGWKPRGADEAATDANRASMTALLFALALGVATSAALVSLTPASTTYLEDSYGDDGDRD